MNSADNLCRSRWYENRFRPVSLPIEGDVQCKYRLAPQLRKTGPTLAVGYIGLLMTFLYKKRMVSYPYRGSRPLIE